MPEQGQQLFYKGMLNTMKSMQRIQQEKQKIMTGMLEADIKTGGSLMAQMLKSQMPQQPRQLAPEEAELKRAQTEWYQRRPTTPQVPAADKTRDIKKKEVVAILQRGWGTDEKGDYQFTDRSDALDYIMNQYDIDITDPEVQNALLPYKEREEKITPASKGFLGIGGRKYPTKEKYGYQYEKREDGKWHRLTE